MGGNCWQAGGAGLCREPEKKAIPTEDNARIVAGTLEGESEIKDGLGKRFRNADEFIDHLDGSGYLPGGEVLGGEEDAGSD